jgi:hypothetical protein
MHLTFVIPAIYLPAYYVVCAYLPVSLAVYLVQSNLSSHIYPHIKDIILLNLVRFSYLCCGPVQCCVWLQTLLLASMWKRHVLPKHR